MDTLSYKTISANKETATKEWVVVDATDQVVGRLGAKVAKLLRGKYKPNFTPHVDCGDNVIIINADKVKFTGNKWNDKIYLSYTGYPGGQREITPARLMAKPNGAEKLMKRVVKGMLPKNRLGLKGVTANLSLAPLADLVLAAEQAVKHDDTEHENECIDAMSRELDAVIKALSKL